MWFNGGLLLLVLIVGFLLRCVKWVLLKVVNAWFLFKVLMSLGNGGCVAVRCYAGVNVIWRCVCVICGLYGSVLRCYVCVIVSGYVGVRRYVSYTVLGVSYCVGMKYYVSVFCKCGCY